MNVIDNIRQLESQASQTATGLVADIGRERLVEFVKQQTGGTLLEGTVVDATGNLDFNVAEERFLRLPPEWLKLAEKFLNDLIEGINNLAAKKETASTTHNTREAKQAFLSSCTILYPG